MKEIRTLLSRIRSRVTTEQECVLEGEELAPIPAPTSSDIEAQLCRLRSAGPSHLCLSSSDGSFVQVAGSIRSLTVELRMVSDDGPTHVVVGRKVARGRMVTVKSTCGPIKVCSNERLRLQDAIELFRAFLDGRSVPKDYTARDVTSELIETSP